MIEAQQEAPRIFEEAALGSAVSRVAYRVALANFVFWAVVFAAVAALEQHLFLLRRYDLGNYAQAVWSTAHGHFLSVTEVGGTQVSRLGIHFDPIIVALVPLWWLWSSPVMLLVVQALALASGAIPLFWLARKHLHSEREAALVSAAYLLCPSLQWNATDEFHAVALAVPLLLLAVWFLDEGRLVSFSLSALLIVFCEEQLGLIVAFLGLWYAWHHRRLRTGLVIAVAGVLASAIEFGVIRHFAGGSPFFGRYTAIGGSFGGMVHNLIPDPIVFVTALHPLTTVWAAFALLLPVLALCVGSAVTLVALPQLALVLLSDRALDADYRTQLMLPIIPFLYVGATFVLARHRQSGRYRGGHVFVASLAATAVLGPFSPFFVRVPSSAHLAAERHAVALVPSDAPVSATNYIGSHLAERRRLDVFPVTEGADWVVVDSTDDLLPAVMQLATRSGIAVGQRDLYPQPRLMKASVRGLMRSDSWMLVYSSHGVSVFRRVRA